MSAATDMPATDTNGPTPQQVLDLPVEDTDSGASTIRGYLVALLTRLWLDDEGFSGKRPFGNSSWKLELVVPLIRAGYITGTLDEHGYVHDYDKAEVNRLILVAIRSLDTTAETADAPPDDPAEVMS